MAAHRAREAADQQFDVLVNQTIHDLRGIISPVKTAVATLQRQFTGGNPDPRLCISNLEMMNERLEFLERFVDDMREYSQASDGAKHREWIHEVVADAVDMAADNIRNAGHHADFVDLKVAVPNDLRADMLRRQITMALFHLIKNAFEAFTLSGAHQSNPTIQVIGREPSPGLVEVVVIDNGPGIHPETLDLLREYVPGRTTKKNEGTGFGLPTAHRYATAHGGHLAINSDGINGTEVVMTLPSESEEDEL